MNEGSGISLHFILFVLIKNLNDSFKKYPTIHIEVKILRIICLKVAFQEMYHRKTGCPNVGILMC